MIVLVHNLVCQTTPTDMIFTTIKANMHETLFYLVYCKKFFVDPPFLSHITILKLGYKSWDVTILISKMFKHR
jgi:hypothetical protein